ncbi:MAG TPA: hypothetical protein GX509_00455 [Firmicutes bacterium]|nr:hypothetical protein [Bacillota bacterium]HHY97189.1 hypothetical protein [Bacillota bacterium]
MSLDENVKTLISYRLTQAKESLEDARKLLQAGGTPKGILPQSPIWGRISLMLASVQVPAPYAML